MEIHHITGLRNDQVRILKQIIIVSDRNNTETELGSIFYKRLITPRYNLAKQAEADKAEKDQFAKFFGDSPQQENYPVDEIDKMIISAIKRNYPKSILRNDLILFNTDLEKLSILKNRNAIRSKIFVSPEFTLGEDLSKYVGKNFSAPLINLNIYTYQNPNSLEGVVFYGTYPLDRETEIENLSNVEFE